LAYLAFFPRIVAGPIVRAGEFLPQLDERPRFTKATLGAALFLLMSGFLKKMAVADFLRENIVDRVFDFPAMYQSGEIVTAAVAFTLQIYGDFAGYTDIALGIALLFGIRLPENFDFPYRSVGLRDFWRRWHKSLSFWLRDYLYISLGGNRVAGWKVYRNLLVTMVLGGLWHGAAWTFVIWGFLHGAALAVERFVERRNEGKGVARTRGPVAGAVGALATFAFVAFAWTFFRADGMQTMRDMAGQIATFTWGLPNVSARVLIVMAAAAAGMWCPHRWYEAVRGAFLRLPWPAQMAVTAAVGYGIYSVSATGLAPFVYEQF
jgi:D-alanyl-lipoteichoic acid acyltransferase DltB (MBOAT superfamily)